ncbi:MAG: GtrA family protein [Alphaproteobacteria bacterium]|nr:MAG: GtrA family protein [Alphaproteobacteria bacterium]
MPWRELACFSAIGVVGLLVDMGVLMMAVHGLGLDPYSGRLLSFLAAATGNWALNRYVTFKRHDRGAPLRQWARYLAANGVGFAVNYSVYGLLVALAPMVKAQPLWGVAAGSVAGLGVNFLASRRFVFRAHPPR